VPRHVQESSFNGMNRLSSAFLVLFSLGLTPRPSAGRAEQNWCGTAQQMMFLKYRVEDMVEGPDSTLMYRIPSPESRKGQVVVEVRDQAICEKATRVYYRDQLGPYPADGVAVVRFGDRYGVLGDRHGGEWTVLEVYNLKFETIAGFWS